jgi:uncharacterized protein YbjT (DUF2867 family)
VRAFVRDPEKVRRLLGDGVELAIGDFADADSVRDALGGVEQLVLSCADDPRRVGWETDAIDAAAAAGVKRVVKLSTVEAEPGAPVAFWDWHGQVEQHLKASAVAAVILRSSFYMSNVLAAAEQVARDGRIYVPADGARIAMIDPRDVGVLRRRCSTARATIGGLTLSPGETGNGRSRPARVRRRAARQDLRDVAAGRRRGGDRRSG